ncbi:PKD domain-containing protein [Cellulomonas palmilytica]|uniref:PKD domain-containing protein n=1 Tax=Cellulomonas palmilytica TaxID=2608402 RepID=UPI001F48D580|nr:PKD domain-containing protein [Cellulomonas palmilytica]UJP40329.1 PKD domain-containing protein [Cellulomonas palmilytica]
MPPAGAKEFVVAGDGDEAFWLGAFKANRQYEAWLRSASKDPDRAIEFKRKSVCVEDTDEEPGIDQPCYLPPGARIEPPPCEDGPALEPLWRRVLRERTEEQDVWTRWELVFGWMCPEHRFPPLTRQEFQLLPIVAPEVNVQPSADVLVNKRTILFTDGAPQRFRTTVFGTWGIDVVATPVEYRWTFGDGESLVTATPGAPYPSFEVTHTFSEPIGATAVGLTVTWKGQFRVDADPLHKWREVTGTARTESVSAPFDVIELRSHLTG